MNLHPLFVPRSVAVIGASTRPGSVGNDIVKNITEGGFSGNIFPVNPKATELYGLRCYPDVAALPEAPELAVIAIPMAGVAGVLEACGQAGTQAAVIISSGFKETGAEGRKEEEKLRAISEKYGLALLGPNCLGFINPAHKLNASFAALTPPAGRVAFFSQSGALATSLLDLSAGRLGFSTFASIGNKAVVRERSLLEYFAKDKDTAAIGFYAEDLEDAPDFIAAARKTASRKPVIALKSGRTDAGSRASSSHTGSLAGSDAAYGALFKQARILRTETFDEFQALLEFLDRESLPAGARVGILTNAGGFGVLSTDVLAAKGLAVPELSEATRKKLAGVLPPAAGTGNPVDVLGDAPADRYRDALEILGASGEVDMILAIVTPQSMTEAEATAEAFARWKKEAGAQTPFLAAFAGEPRFETARKILAESGIAQALYPEAAALTFANAYALSRFRAMGDSQPFTPLSVDTVALRAQLAKWRETGTQPSESETRAWLARYGFIFPKEAKAQTLADALSAAETLAEPYVLKIISPDIIHKSDAGGVMLRVSRGDIGSAYKKLIAAVHERAPQARVEGVLISEMAPSGGTEYICGIKAVPGLGHMIMAGLGGIYVEMFQDVAFRFAPLSRDDAREMISELKSSALFQGARGQAALSEDSLIEALGRLSQLASDFPEISELDINPLVLYPGTADQKPLALDARMRITS